MFLAEVTSDLIDQFTLSTELFVACSIMAYSLTLRLCINRVTSLLSMRGMLPRK